MYVHLIKTYSLVLSNANILFFFLYIFNTIADSRNQLCFVGSQWIHLYRTGIYGYGYIHGYPRKICGYGYGWEISYPRQPWVRETCVETGRQTDRHALIMYSALLQGGAYNRKWDRHRPSLVRSGNVQFVLTELDQQVLCLGDGSVEVFCCQIQYHRSIAAAAAVVGVGRENQHHGNHQRHATVLTCHISQLQCKPTGSLIY